VQSIIELAVISVRVVPEASTSASLCAHRDLRSFAAVCECRAGSPKPAAGGGGSRRPGTVCRAGCMRLGGSRAFQLPHRGRGLVEARAGCLERSGTLGHQVYKRLPESRRSTSESASGSTVASRSLRQADRARWRGHRACRCCGRCRSRVRAPELKAWVARLPPTRRPLPTSLPGTDLGH
jgi:hypothetical protein